MRKLIVFILSLLPFTVLAQGVERVFVSSDRSVYISGDEIWCSVFCLDGTEGKLSGYSAVCYVELVSEEGTVASAKIALMEGRGAGKFRIPVEAPTGNYRLLAYTAKYPDAFCPGARTVSVFNTTSVARVKNGVRVTDGYEPQKTGIFASDGLLSISLREIPVSGKSFSIGLKNGSDAATLSLSVYAVDSIREPENGDMYSFIEALPSAGGANPSSKTGEYEGEIIYAAVEGLEGEALVTLSSAGSPSDVYVGKVGESGRLMFFTNNIYGDRELVCEVGGKSGNISLLDPFRYPSLDSVEVLELSPGLAGDLLRRKAALHASLQADTLVDFIPRRQDILLEKVYKTTYHLDDYTRFPSFNEVIVEIVPELRIRKIHGEHGLQLIVPDASGSRRIVKDNILVMLDGVVISSLSLLEGMDAMLLQDIDIYEESIALGGISYNGCVNFITRRNYVKALQFPSNVRVVDFKGVCYPEAYLGTPISGTDNRQLLYWNPIMELPAGESKVISLTAPSVPGIYRIKADGLTVSGKPVHEILDIEVR